MNPNKRDSLAQHFPQLFTGANFSKTASSWKNEIRENVRENSIHIRALNVLKIRSCDAVISLVSLRETILRLSPSPPLSL